MNDLRDLYQEVILDHNKRPRNFRIIPQPTHKADGINPLCGDRVSVYLDIQEGVIKDIAFQGAGCAISSASASLMTELLKGKDVNEVEYLFNSFHSVVTTDCDCPKGLGKLRVLAGIRDYPSRVKCATLAWHAMRTALESS
jgi:nitrogen fixation NifU-like protein